MYTKSERREIYLKAAEHIDNELWWCICGVFHRMGIPHKEGEMTENYKKKFPEFALFDPEHDSKIWFPVHEKKARVFALLLMSEMCS
jgi:hypothetical protein